MTTPDDTLVVPPPWLAARQGRALRAAWLGLVVVLVGYAVTTVPAARPDPGYSALVDDWVQNGVLVTATLLVAARSVLVAERRLAWAAVAVGVGLHAVGHTAFFGWVQVLDPLPSPTVAGAAWLASYAFLWTGVLGLARPRTQAAAPRLWLDGLVAALGLSAVAAIGLDVVHRSTEGSLHALATALTYPVCDVVLLVVVVVTCAVQGWRPDRAWFYLGLGLGLFAVADTIYSLRVATGSYEPGTMLDPLWAVAAVALAAAALRPPTAPVERPAHGSALLVVPVLFVLLALTLLVIGTQRHLPPAAIALAALTALTGLLRAAMIFRDVQTLSGRRQQARTDELTGLGNRRLFHEVASARIAARGPGEQLAVLLLDLDRFKEVNDALGHTVGDRLVVEVGRRLAQQLRQDDLLVRLGGDEFAVLLDSAGPAHSLSLARRLRASVQSQFDVDGVCVYIDVSIGIALCPDAAEDVEGLMQRADIAMYQAKSDRVGAVIYAAGDTDLTARLTGVDALRSAIDEEQLVLHYQPKVALSTGAVTGVEALVRWQHPERGLLSPDLFIPQAERYGFMRQLTAWVLTTALDQVRTWRDVGGPASVAVNVSVSNLLDTDLPDQIATMLALRGLPGSALTVEITEDVLMADAGRATHVLQSLRLLGVGVSIDDYGTGYSSLARLRDLPVTELKLDRSFIRNIENDPRTAEIVRSTVQLTHSLGLELVAEGVETEAARRLLVQMGCDTGQGHHLGQPFPAALVAPREPAESLAGCQTE